MTVSLRRTWTSCEYGQELANLFTSWKGSQGKYWTVVCEGSGHKKKDNRKDNRRDKPASQEAPQIAGLFRVLHEVGSEGITLGDITCEDIILLVGILKVGIVMIQPELFLLIFIVISSLCSVVNFPALRVRCSSRVPGNVDTSGSKDKHPKHHQLSHYIPCAIYAFFLTAIKVPALSTVGWTIGTM
jgi:hypothetical protein